MNIIPLLYLTNIIVWCCQKCILLCFVTTILYSLGYIHRFLWYIVEREAQKIFNGTLVTCSTIQFDLFRGKVWVTNCIIHAPQQQIWDWEAPIFARIGKVYVEVNIISCLFSLWCLWEELPLDLYTIAISDIQVFIERKHNIYNFLLLDPHVVVPIPNSTTATSASSSSTTATEQQQQQQQQKMETTFDNTGSVSNPATPTVTSTLDLHASKGIDNDNDDDEEGQENNKDNDTDVDDDNVKKAQQVVEQIVQSARHAAAITSTNDSNNNNKNPVHTLLDQYRHLLSNQLKSLTQQQQQQQQMDTKNTAKKNTNNNENTTTTTTTTSTSKMMLQEGVNFIKHMTANIAEKTVQVQQVIVPERRSIPGERPVYGRIGRLLIQDMRIFVREQNYTPAVVSTTTTTSSTPTTKNNSNNNNDNIPAPAAAATTTTTTTTANIAAWNPPIVIPCVAFRANEFCPPLTAKERRRNDTIPIPTTTTTTNNNNNNDFYDPTIMPALYQSMDVYVDIIWKRILAEIAKSNTDQFFQTAMGEVVHLFVDSTTTTTPTTTTIVPPPPPSVPSTTTTTTATSSS